MGSEVPFILKQADWEITTLGALCEAGGGDIQTGPFGSQLHAEDYVEDGIPSIMPKNISVEGISVEDIARISESDANRLARYLVNRGDIIYSRRGDVEKCALITEREQGWLCGTGCLRVRLGRQAKLPPEYLHAYLSHPGVRAWIAQRAIGATMPNLNTGILASVPVVVPDQHSAEAVANCWSSINKNLVLNRQINQTLEEIAQAIFKSWFVDFDPVRAKIAAKGEGRDPLRAAMSAISGKDDAALDQLPPEQFEQLAATAALFPDEMDKSELGEIPRGWTCRPFTAVIDVNPPRQLKKGVLAPYLDMANVPTNSFRVGNVVDRKFGSGSKFTNGDTLLARITPCLENGKTAFVDFLDGDEVGWGSTEFIVLKPKAPLPVSFAYFLCRHPEFRAFAIANMTGTSGRQRVPTDCFTSYLLAVPDRSIGEAFEFVAGSIMTYIKARDEESRTLATVRDILLPKLLSGELAVTSEIFAA